ncbi:anti-sigma factor [Rhizobium sp. BK251]|uniref:anti-sigma factor n=1 Tax=Rhizobium sp. BK251 TaxID=2512125 RepID=UPI00104DC7AB|nr:anti-sigma factor [Rhizobium sp. BK251]TCL72238.1 anti-sigma-K factor RskA [Rhizobium sp. BK251]
MTSSDQSKGGRSGDEVLAGEYVLGVLSLQDRRIVEERMRRDRQFAAIVSRWEENLSAFNDDYEIVAPARETFKQVESRLFIQPEAIPRRPPGLWRSVIFWRSLTFLSAAVAAVAIVAASGSFRSPQAPALIAELAGQNSQISLLASYDSQSGRLRIVPVAIGAQGEKSLQLWLVPGSGPPKSLGVFEPDRSGQLVVPSSMRSSVSDGATLAVSVEPLGGSPTGQATGLMIATGTAHRP